MHFRKTPAARRKQQDAPAPAPAPAGIQRLELLWWRFSAAEVQRLSLLQLVQRERPSALDLPLEECRLRFARWLVATGRLSEQTECRLAGGRLAGQPWAQEAAGPAEGEAAVEAEGQAAAEVLACAGAEPTARARLPAEVPSGEPPPPSAQPPPPSAQPPPLESAQGNRPMDRRLLLLGAGRQLRRGMARVAAFGRALGRMDYLSDAGGPWGPYGTWGPYGPWGPYGSRGPYDSARSVADDPWRWTRLRHDS
jgi:hypothetical protein